jgi:hypothetical protein
MELNQKRKLKLNDEISFNDFNELTKLNVESSESSIYVDKKRFSRHRYQSRHKNI